MHDTEVLLDASQNPKLNRVFEKYSVRKIEVSKLKTGLKGILHLDFGYFEKEDVFYYFIFIYFVLILLLLF